MPQFHKGTVHKHFFLLFWRAVHELVPERDGPPQSMGLNLQAAFADIGFALLVESPYRTAFHANVAPVA